MCINKIKEFWIFPKLEHFVPRLKKLKNHREIFLDAYFRMNSSALHTIVWVSVFVLIQATSIIFSINYLNLYTIIGIESGVIFAIFIPLIIIKNTMKEDLEILMKTLLELDTGKNRNKKRK